MKKALLTLISVICISISAFGQGSTKHLVYPKFTNGVVYFNSGERLDASLNYSLITGKMLFLSNQGVIEVSNQSKISHVNISGTIFIPENDVFYQVIREGEDGLYYQYYGKLIPAGKPTLYGTTSQVSSALSLAEIGVVANKLEMPEDYKVQVDNKYFWYRNGKYTPFTSLKDICNAFPKHEKDIKNFIKEKKNKLKTHQEHLDVLDYCISL
ncbi:MAG: hypothetical protein PHD21_06205 [Flavobacteriales bacterium]|nr:hypothetical protein [Flavobacteriales bacterium]